MIMLDLQKAAIAVLTITVVTSVACADPILQRKGAKIVRKTKLCPTQDNCFWTAEELKKTFNYSVTGSDPDKLVRSADYRVFSAATDDPPRQDIPITPSATGSFDVKFPWDLECETQQGLFLLVCVANDVHGVHNDCESVDYTLTCRKSLPKPRVGGEEYYYVPPSGTPSVVPVTFELANLDLVSHTVNLQSGATQPSWTIDPPIPSSVVLGPAESIEIAFGVTVPGGTPNGGQDAITLTATFADDPLAQSAATNTVVVAPNGACCGVEACLDTSAAECASLLAPWNYQGDGTTCAEVSCVRIPAVSTWGVAILGLLLVTACTIILQRKHSPSQEAV